MGEVYRARDTRLGRDVAVKVLPAAIAGSPEMLARFEREARTLAALSHPNILAIHDVGFAAVVSAGRPAGAPPVPAAPIAYAVTELLEGQTLRERLAHGKLPPRRAADIAAQIARGLDAAHAKSVVHRDLKPENLFVTTDGRVKILDFGLARLEPSDASDQSTHMEMTRPGTLLGTPGYMAPEQVRGEPADHRADIFAFGVVLHEMLTGRRAFKRDTAPETMAAILNEEPPDVTELEPGTPATMARLVQHCLEKTPSERFQSAKDLTFALETIATTSESGARAAIRPRRRRFAWLAAGLFLALLVVTLGWIFLGGRPAAPASVVFAPRTFRPMTVFRALFGPDGETITMSAALEGNEPELFEIHPNERAPRALGFRRTHLLSVSSKGELAVLTNARYVRHRVFRGTFATFFPGTEPHEQADDVREADWSPDGTALAFIRHVEGKDRLEFRDKVLYEEPGGYLSDLCVSPSGTHIAFSQHAARYNDTGRVIIIEVSTGRQVAVTADYDSVKGVSWLPDGRGVLIGANTNTSSERQILAMDLAGSVRTVLASPGSLALHHVSPSGRWLVSREDEDIGMRTRGPGAGAEIEAGWMSESVALDLSPDGKRVLFAEQSLFPIQACVRGTDGSSVKRIGDGVPLAFSRDGRSALVAVGDAWRLSIFPLGVGTARMLESGLLQRVRRATFLPDGSRVLACGNERGQPPRCYLNDGPGGGWRAVTRNGTAAIVSNDGREVIVLDDLAGPSRYRLDGSLTPLPIPGVSTSDFPVAWSPDGRSAYFADTLEMPGRICRVDLTTGTREETYRFGLANLSGVLRWMSVLMARDADAYAYSYVRQLSKLYVVEGVR
jgi:hypothetical protein